MRDAEWRRLVHCADLYHGPVPGLEPMLEPGELQGRWDGFYRAPDLTQYESLIQAHNAPPPQWLVRPDVNDPPAYYKQTVQWRLREYHCLAGSGNIPLSADTDWAIDAWFPSTWTYDHLPDGTLRVWDPVRRAYTNYVPHAPNRTRAQVLDTIVLGQPDDDWKALWGDFAVYGRVRQADGLVVLRRDCMPPDAGLGRWLWYGYVHNGLNWIGRFRSTGVQVGLIAYAGSFMMARSQIS
ncbi:hypothetical protein EXIGLDRAFT_844587 [Exidia glandulosa HHB12029]|uniref:Uncharacterized protein n=1 Tax=Exidia glandulosa HHB12029 TaxID=1314781 RepID=A0A165BYP0_EXIGL|nr:hypothetical protein EXIGLDRAFT_844587 [Exidia glandulosa HHB12029]